MGELWRSGQQYFLEAAPRLGRASTGQRGSLVSAGGDRGGSLSAVAGARGSGGHTLHAGSEGVKVGGLGAGPGWLGRGAALASLPVWVVAPGNSALTEVRL